MTSPSSRPRVIPTSVTAPVGTCSVVRDTLLGRDSARVMTLPVLSTLVIV